MELTTDNRPAIMKVMKATQITIGTKIELITVAASHPVALAKGMRQTQYAQGPKSPTEFVPVTAVSSKRSNYTFTFADGRILTVSANSKVPTS